MGVKSWPELYRLRSIQYNVSIGSLAFTEKKNFCRTLELRTFKHYNLQAPNNPHPSMQQRHSR